MRDWKGRGGVCLRAGGEDAWEDLTSTITLVSCLVLKIKLYSPHHDIHTAIPQECISLGSEHHESGRSPQMNQGVVAAARKTGTKGWLKKCVQALESCFKPLVWGFFGSVLDLNEFGGWMALQEESPGAMQVLLCWLCIFYQKRAWDVHFWWRQITPPALLLLLSVCSTDTSARECVKIRF